jgi:hypothetical protein
MMMPVRSLRVVLFGSLLAGCSSSSSTSSPDGGPGVPEPALDGSTGGDVAAMDATASDAAPGGDAAQALALGFAPSNVVAATSGPISDVDITGHCKINPELGQLECDPGGAATGTFSFQRQVQTGAGSVGVFVVRSLRVEPGATLQILGDLPLAVIASERIDILGAITGSAHKEAAIAGGFSGHATSPTGAGPGGGSPGAVGYHGGGGGSYCGNGGGGGVDVGEMPPFPSAHPGKPYGSLEIVPLMGGSSGGGDPHESTGGAGGGAVQLVAGKEIVIGDTGVIAVSGGGGRAGGGGGGSGGAVLLEAPKVTVTGVVAANGGGGGIFTGGSGGQDGTATSTPAAGEAPDTGGSGSAGASVDGQAGLSTRANATSGGGGGAGRIRINTADGKATLGDKLSPAAGSACVSVGMLRPAAAPPPAPPAGTPRIAFKPSNVDLTALAAMPVDDLVLTQRCHIETEKGEFVCGYFPVKEKFAFAVATQPGAGKVGVLYVRSLRIEPGAELLITGKLPLVLASAGPLAIHGGISGRAQAQQAIAGGFMGADANGTGLAGGAAGTGNYHGGGGGGYCGAGGAGAAINGEPVSAGGKPAGSPALVPLVGGSSGGGAGDPGGAGGGAVQLVSGDSIDIGVGGLIDVGGGRAAGGGGGSGGAILLEAPTVSVRGTLAANGGGGGVFAGGSGGQEGRSNAEPATGERPDTGGHGSAGDSADGEAGLSVRANLTSGGGGGAGRIRINTSSGQATLTGVLSPSAASGCLTTGTTMP